MRFVKNVNSCGQLYMPRQLIEEWGRRLVLYPNEKVMVIYPYGTDASEVVASLRILLLELENQSKKEKLSVNKLKAQVEIEP